MRDGPRQCAQAARGSDQQVKTVDNGLLLLTNRVHCSQLGFTHNDESDLSRTRAGCVDIYTFPNDLSEEESERNDRLYNGYVKSVVKGSTGSSTSGYLSRASNWCEVGTETVCLKAAQSGKMSTVEHQATVDKGLKMKIKRKSVGAKSAESKHEIVKGEVSKCNSGNTDTKPGSGLPSAGPSSTPAATGLAATDKAAKHGVQVEKEKSPKLKNTHKKEKAKDKVKPSDIQATGQTQVAMNGVLNSCVSGNMYPPNGLDVNSGNVSLPTSPEPKAGEVPCSSKPSLDPYEFNAKVEDGIGVPMKKIKVEKVETASSPVHPSSCQDASTEMCSVGVSTEPECLGPCEPGTSVTLEGIVWHETENGVLVINVTWRGKTYVGTLLDATRHDWAPPRLTSESPVSDLEVRTPKGRGKRGRGVSTPVVDRTVGANDTRKLRKGRRTSNANGFQAPPSPAKSDISTSGKRKGRPPELDLASITEGAKPPKRSRSSSRGTPNVESPSSILIECPEPNCNKKYKHINGLRYHQTHAHQNISPVAEQTCSKDEKMEDAETDKTVENSDNASKDNKNSVKGNGDSGSKKLEKLEKCSKSDVNNELDEQSTVTTRQSRSMDSQKSESSSKKKDNSISQSVTTTTSTVSKSSVSPQIFQLAAGPIGCLGGASSSSSATVSTVTSTCSASSVPAPSNTTSLLTSTSDSPKSETLKDADKNIKTEKGDKSKSKSSTRPIMPAPSPQMIALSSNVPVSHSSPVSTHAQMSPSLKPIQPKPTIMGEPSNVNPSLMGLKDKKAKSKKKSSKEKEAGKSNPKDNVNLKDDSVKSERSGVIKSAATSPKSAESTKKDASLAETSKLIAEAQRSVTSNSMVSQLSPNLIETPQSVRQSGTRDLSKTGSPLQVNTPDGKGSPVNEDVQSPAYSDISDANDSGSPVSNEEIVDKSKHEENESKKEEKVQQQPRSQGTTENPPMSQYGMYSYYGQHQYPHMVPNVPQPHNLSQNNQKSTPASREETEVKSIRDSDGIKKERDLSPTGANEDNKPKPHVPEIGPPGRQQQMTPQQMQEYQVHQQKWMQQMYALQSLPPQYQYLAAYGYGVDQPFHMHHMASDPHYRQHAEKMMEEQKRAQEERYKAEEREHGKEMSKREDARDLSTPKYGQLSTPNSKSADRPTDLRRPFALHSNESAAREQTLRDKRMENHQIIKENIELKPQMDREKSKQEYEAAIRMQDRNEDDLKKYHKYQQQMALQQRVGDRKSDISLKQCDPSPSKSNSSEKLSLDHKPHSSGLDLKDLHKKDITELKNRESSAGIHTGDSKSEDKRGDKSRNEDPRRPGFPGSTRSSPSSVNTTTSNNPSQAPYASYISYPYMQSPYQIPFDPNHPMYRGINPVIGYANHSYLHPSQLGYRGGQGEDEKAKVNLVASGSPSPKVVPNVPQEPETKAVDLLQQHASQYYQGHKIHELQEKGRSSSRSSPMPKGTEVATAGPVANLDKHRDASTKSPPTQRHVHTHHHTHVVGGFPMYGPYGAPILGQQSSTPTSPAAASPPSLPTPTTPIQRPFPSK